VRLRDGCGLCQPVQALHASSAARKRISTINYRKTARHAASNAFVWCKRLREVHCEAEHRLAVCNTLAGEKKTR
jgi:hypothetical protein